MRYLFAALVLVGVIVVSTFLRLSPEERMEASRWIWGCLKKFPEYAFCLMIGIIMTRRSEDEEEAEVWEKNETPTSVDDTDQEGIPFEDILYPGVGEMEAFAEERIHHLGVSRCDGSD